MYQNNISFLYFILIRLFAQKKRNYAVNNKMKNGSSGITPVSYTHLTLPTKA